MCFFFNGQSKHFLHDQQSRFLFLEFITLCSPDKAAYQLEDNFKWSSDSKAHVSEPSDVYF